MLEINKIPAMKMVELSFFDQDDHIRGAGGKIE